VVDWYTLDSENVPVKCESYKTRHLWIASLSPTERTAIGRRIAYWANESAAVSTVFVGSDDSGSF